MKNLIIAILSVLFISSCIEPINDTFSKLPTGVWRGVLVVDKQDYKVLDDNDNAFDNTNKKKIEKRIISGGELPFKMNVRYLTKDKFVIDVHNGAQVVTIDSIIYNRDRKTAKDTIQFAFREWGTYVNAIYEDDIMEGYFYVPYRDKEGMKYRIPFKAFHGKDYRFSTTKKKPVTDISGKWSAEFTEDDGSTYTSIGEFKQDGNHLLGTFMSETGDTGYLEGSIEEDRFSLSIFDGTHAYLYEGKLTDDNNIVGSFKSGKHYRASWTAKRNPDAQLQDAFSLSKLTAPEKPMALSYPDLDGNLITLEDARFDNKIKLIKISGSWCPNCKDESDFLKEYLNKHKDYPIEVVEINFERSKDDAKNIERLKQYYHKGSPFTILYAGRASRDSGIPEIEEIKSYPTLLFVDKNNMIRKVHTGFSGPATTGYEPFKKEFDTIIKQLLEE